MRSIAIDVDGTVSNMHQSLLDLYNEDWHDNLTADKITDWDIAQFVKPECGEKIYEYFSHPDLYRNSELISGSLKNVTILRKSGFHIIWATTAAKGSEGRKKEYLSQKYLLYPHDEYIETGMKYLIDADYMIDDFWENFYGFTGTKILYQQPWNIGHRDECDISFNNWDSISKFIINDNYYRTE